MAMRRFDGRTAVQTRDKLMKRGAVRTGAGARLQEALMRNHDFRAARPRITVSVGESVRIVRELQKDDSKRVGAIEWDFAIHHLRYG